MKDAVVVAGNGPSLKNIDYTKLPIEYDVFRVNRFYHEEKYYLGKNIKAVFHIPHHFFDEYHTMQQLVFSNEYNIENIICKMYNFADRKEKIFRENFKYFFPLASNGYDEYFSRLVKLSAKLDYDSCYLGNRIEMLTGTYAIACAVACGYKEIYLAGMDFCDKKYLYSNGQEVIDPNNKFIHNYNFDIQILNYLKNEYNAKIFSVCPNSTINKYIMLSELNNKTIYNITERIEGAIKKPLLPNLSARKRYKRIYLEANPFINLFYGFLRTPRALKHYLSSKFYR
ncbi:TPA: alpha-2,3 sialyltransferase [Campylobacter lari]|nr:alpha-2,3 sialyltransferase [Campylobacter lari]